MTGVPERLRGLFRGGSDGNERLTAATGAVLLLLLAAEGLTLLAIQQLLLPHVFLGFLLIPPVLLKLASTGWRTMHYYRHDGEYVRRGPPPLLLRILIAPLVVLSTIALFATGVVVVALGQRGLWLGLHKASFIVWVGAMSVHVLAHVLKLPRLVAVDWWRGDKPAGRRARQFVVAASLVAGLITAMAAIPLVDHWQDQTTSVVGFDGR
ncbi:MAG TPA: hypothetical protein VH108_13290 [Gaiellaceae bacterium]|nr:hypothetical protein [Gaiellaceae bacterium]